MTSSEKTLSDGFQKARFHKALYVPLECDFVVGDCCRRFLFERSCLLLNAVMFKAIPAVAPSPSRYASENGVGVSAYRTSNPWYGIGKSYHFPHRTSTILNLVY